MLRQAGDHDSTSPHSCTGIYVWTQYWIVVKDMEGV